MGIGATLNRLFEAFKEALEERGLDRMQEGNLVDFNKDSELYWLKRAGEFRRIEEEAAKSGSGERMPDKPQEFLETEGGFLVGTNTHIGRMIIQERKERDEAQETEGYSVIPPSGNQSPK